MSSEENIWIDQIKKGDRAALNKLYDTLRQPCLAWLSKRHRMHMEDLVDIFQNGVIVLYRQIGRGKLDHKTASLKTYLFAVCQNLALKKCNVIKTEKTIDIDTKLIVDWNLNVHDHIEEAGKKQLINKAIQQLGTHCKGILSLFYYDHFSIESIQKKLEYKSNDVVRTHKRRCMDRLKKAFKQSDN